MRASTVLDGSLAPSGAPALWRERLSVLVVGARALWERAHVVAAHFVPAVSRELTSQKLKQPLLEADPEGFLENPKGFLNNPKDFIEHTKDFLENP